MDRRDLLKQLSSTIAVIGIAGCSLREENQENVTTKTDNMNSTQDTFTTEPSSTPSTQELSSPTVVDEEIFDNWEPDTNCNNGKRESMYNSEISISDVESTVNEEEYNPIQYTQLPVKQKRIIYRVLTTGGYAVCSASEAFQEFTANATYSNGSEQEDDTTVYLLYDNTYYQLFIRVKDMQYLY